MNFERRLRLNREKDGLAPGEQAAGWHFCPKNRNGLLLGPGDEGFGECGCEPANPFRSKTIKVDGLADRLIDMTTALHTLASANDVEFNSAMMGALSLARVGGGPMTDKIREEISTKVDDYARKHDVDWETAMHAVQAEDTAKILSDAGHELKAVYMDGARQLIMTARSLIGMIYGVIVQSPPEPHVVEACAEMGLPEPSCATVRKDIVRDLPKGFTNGQSVFSDKEAFEKVMAYAKHAEHYQRFQEKESEP